MEIDEIELNENEVFLLKTENVSRGAFGTLGNDLILTNQAILFVKHGMLGGIKEILRFPLNEVSQPIAEEDATGVCQLVFQFGRKRERFGFPLGTRRTTRLWVMAINDRYNSERCRHNAAYYAQFSDANIVRAAEQDSFYGRNSDAEKDAVTYGADMLKGITTSYLKTGSIGKAIKKQVKESAKKQLKSNISSALLNNSEIEDLQDEFTEIGNEFREAFGFRPKETNKDRKEKALDEAFEQQIRRVELKEREIREAAMRTEREESAERERDTHVNQGNSIGISEQIDLLRKLKDLLDEGVLTQEEFDAKKAEIMKG